MSNAVLRVNNLDVEYHTDAGAVKANNHVTFELRPKERLGLVGESGSGKSTLALAILRMIRPPGKIAGGEVWLDGVDLTKISDEEMRRMRGNEISMVPQGAMNSLNPVMRIEDQIIDGMVDHNLGLSRSVMKEMAAEALRAVDLDPKVGRSYPHELSGGMKQRACIAISIVMTPKVIIADEPTSALDVVTQRQVMQTIGKIQDQMGSAVILIGHDMGLMAQFVDRIAVMYAGRMMELGTVKDIFTDALHPYTQALIDSLPVLANRGIFNGLPGITPSLLDLPTGCVFNTRCSKVMDICTQKVPPLREHAPGRFAACHLLE
ncbi:MAG: ABC transporter ATP-binding protein [Caldilineaceae bacterium]|nr:ABC transporter ATP-binding protein [Caldilineaceae bacterium]MCB9156431.1 ABC transporter ATP-binding protein [Caldilineaceae bacterium]